MKYHELTAPRLRELNRTETLVIVPIAAVEQHGPHLPTGTDTLICTAVAEAIERALADRVLLAPTCWLGASAHHLRFGATLSADLTVYIDSLCEIGRCLIDDGFCRILFLNGHGGNVDPMKVAVRQLQQTAPQALLAAGCYWSVAHDLMQQTLDGGHRFVGHACEFETSLIMHLRPELVDESQLADAGPLVPGEIDGMFLGRDMKHRTRQGCTGRPDLATAAKGEQLFSGIVTSLTHTCQTLLDQPLATEYPQFFPPA